jgi:hypothetical protein
MKIDVYADNPTVPDPITSQDLFNQTVVSMFSDLYDVTSISPRTIAAGEPDADAIRDRSDVAFRGKLAALAGYVFPDARFVEADDLPLPPIGA